MRDEQLYDVWAINLGTHRVRLMAQGKTLRNAEAIVSMAVLRRGVEEEFYAEAPAGRYHEGDLWGRPRG